MARYIIDLDELETTAKIAKSNADVLGVRLLMALKSFPLPAAFPTLAPYLSGVTASGLYEAKLGKIMGRDVHVHAPAYQPDEIDELCDVCSHIVFNSLSQLKLYGYSAKTKGVSIGLRLNPGVSSADCLKYDPCCPDSRFGVLFDELEDADTELLELVDGLHVHALCEGYADDFAQMVETLAEKLPARRFPNLTWVNLGGGEVINDPAFASSRAIAAVKRLKSIGAFEVMIEPSEYLVRYSGYLEANVLDVIHREKDIAVLDISASCHATDLVLFDMKPDIVSPEQSQNGKTTIVGCVSCLAGDVLGEYIFAKPLEVGDIVTFGGLGCYSFAQQSWFNGIRHPDIVIRSKANGESTVLKWGYDEYLREFHKEPSCVRKATLKDAEKIYALVRLNSDQLVPRSLGSIVEAIDRFFVAEAEGEMVGCASYQIHPEIGKPEAAAVEIVSVAVKSPFRRRGIGKKLIEAVIEVAKAVRPKEIVVLTFAPEFFGSLGFVEIPKTKIMHKLYTGCINCTKHADPFTCPELAMELQI